MIEDILKPHICDRFLNDARYREGHLRVVNALPHRRVMGLHTPDMKLIARNIVRQGTAAETIARFENEDPRSLTYEETVIWGFLINLQKLPLGDRLGLVARFVPTMDNWAVCDMFCCNAKWMAKTDKEVLWDFLQPYFDSKREFEVRFAVIASMCSHLQEEWLDRLFDRLDRLDFDNIESEYKSVKGKPKTPQEGTVQGAEPYYVRMGAAWLLATALAKFPDRTRSFVNGSHLPADVVKLYIRKARESFRTRNIDAL